MFITEKKYILSKFKRVGLYKKIYWRANPLSKVHNGELMNNEDRANTQNSTIHPENNVYRYIKAKKLVTSTMFWKHNAWTPFWHELLLRVLFFWSEATTHSLSFLPGNCVSFIVAEGCWTGSWLFVDSEAKESWTSFMYSHVDFGFPTVSLYKI